VYALYSLLLSLALFVIVPAYFVKLRIMRGEKLHLRERFGLKVPARRTDRPLLWIHAVSVGEVISLQNLVSRIKAEHPEWELGFSTLTDGGFRVGRAKLSTVDHLFFVPFDFRRIARRFFRSLRPDLLILAESEFWPGLLREARRSRCPVLLVNGRISARSFRRLKRWKGVARKLLGNVDRFLVQTTADEGRLIEIGVTPGLISVSGNLKCDTRLPEVDESEIGRVKKALSVGKGRKVLVAGSIHPGEETRLIQAFREARGRGSDILLILAPRHPEKFADFEKNAGNDGFVARRKTLLRPGQAWDILLVDTIGDLARLYALADAAFIGGSLIPWGGQNLLEPAFYGKPIFFGPHMENFASLADEFVRGGAAKIVKSPEDLVGMFLFNEPAGLEEMGKRAKALLNSLQGATQKTLASIEDLIARRHE